MKIKTIFIFVILILILMTSCEKEGHQLQGTSDELSEISTNHLTTTAIENQDDTIPPIPTSPGKSSLETVAVSGFIQKEAFLKSVNSAKTYELDEPVSGLILPHHDVASYMMGDLYNSVSKVVNPEVIYLIGPNHYDIGERFQIGEFQFATHEGIVEAEVDSIDSLMKSGLYTLSSKSVFEKEHSLNIHLNFIKHYFPDAKVVPIIIREPGNSKDLEKIADTIYATSKSQNALFMSSIDFSHYLTLVEANAMDDITRENLEHNDIKSMMQHSSDYIDCPAGIAILIYVMKAYGTDHPMVLDHNNSANIMQLENIKETTSYFSVIYSGEYQKD